MTREQNNLEPQDTGSLDGEDPSLLKVRLDAHRRFVDVMHALMRAGGDPPAEAELMKLLERSLETAVAITESEMGTFMVQDHDGMGLVAVLTEGYEGTTPRAWTQVPRDRGIAHWVASHNRTAVVNNVSNDARCGPELDEDRKQKTRSVLAAPMVSREQVLGVVEVINKRDGALYTIRDQKRLELMCHFDGKLLAELESRSARETATGKAS